MEDLNLSATEESPEITTNSVDGRIEIKGKSLMEDASSYYEPVKEWIRSYISGGNKPTTFAFKFDYFNSSSTKQILQLIMLFKQLEATEQLTIDWYYNEEDEMILERGEEVQLMLDLPFNFKSFTV